VLAMRYLPQAVETLREAVRIPVDGDSLSGTSNHEGPRIEYLRQRLREIGAVDSLEDSGIDAFGNLWWKAEDRQDGIAPGDRVVIYLDGHCDTVAPLRSRWHEVLGGGLDPHLGMTDPDQIERRVLKQELGYLPPAEEWSHLLFGRGTADQLAGVVCQMFATRILRDLQAQGSLLGVTLWSYVTVAEEDNDGGGPMYYMSEAIGSRDAARIPDVVILTEPTGSAEHGALGIYRGQRGRMQIEVEVVGKSSHGSMPWEGRNPLEHGAAMIAEAAAAHERGEGMATDPFLGPGSRTASFATLRTPSDCAVPETFTFRLDRRLTVGEDPQQALADIASLPAVERARQSGLRVEVRAPIYEQPTWQGYVLGNQQIYPGWSTPETHPAIAAACETYKQSITVMVDEGLLGSSGIREPRVGRWVFSTDGVGVPVTVEVAGDCGARKAWIESGRMRHPAIFGIGPGCEENTHKIGEYVDAREMAAVIAFLGVYPATLRRRLKGV
jgi:putative selenium metabolism hydrolase